MKKILSLLLLMIPFLAKAQICADEDTVRSVASSLITATTARINGTVGHFSGAVTTLQLRYVRVGQIDTVTASSSPSTALRNLTGLQSNTQYVYYYKSVCGSGTKRGSNYYFTTLTATVVYATERSTVFPYLKADTGLAIPKVDTNLYRASAQPSVVYKVADNTYYGYYLDCSCWKALATDSVGIIGLLDLKVDSVTVSGDSLFWWNDHGISHGYILPVLANVWKTDASNTGGSLSLGTPGAQGLTIKTNATDRITVSSGGNTTIMGGNLIFASTGGSSINATPTGVSNEGDVIELNPADSLVVSGLANATNSDKLIGQYSVSGRFNQVILGSNLSLSGGTLSAAGSGISGSGTTNYISKWTGAAALGNSQIADDGTFVGIGAAPTSPYKLHVEGAINVWNGINSIRASSTSVVIGDVESTGNDVKLTIDDAVGKVTVTGGIVGIGTASPDSTLTVAGSIRATGRIRFSGLPTTGTYYKNVVMDANGNLFGRDTSAGSSGTVTSIATSAPITGGTITTTGTIGVDTSTANTGLTTLYQTGLKLSTATAAATYLPLAGAAYTTTTGDGLALTTSTLTTGNLMKLTNTSTLNNGAGLLSIVSSGANSTASKTTYGQQISVTNTGTTSTNVGLNVSASGGTNNYAALFTGNVGIGTSSPTAAKLQVTGNGAASVSGGLYDGTWYTGGSATTTKPQILIETAGATSSNWNTAGTGLGVNSASGFTGDIASFQLNGADRVRILYNGNIQVYNGAINVLSGGVTANSDIVTQGYFGGGTGKSWLRSATNGNWTVYNNATTDFNLFQFGGTTSSFPAIKRNSTDIEIKLADNSAYTGLITGTLTVSSARLKAAKGANVASAGDLTLGADGNLFHITGTTTINAITTTNWQAGSEIILIFDADLTVKNNTAGGGSTAVMKLAGAVDFAAATNSVIKLVYDGAAWYEVSRSMN